MPAGGGDLQCPLGLFLTDDVAQIGAVAGGVRSGGVAATGSSPWPSRKAQTSSRCRAVWERDCAIRPTSAALSVEDQLPPGVSRRQRRRDRALTARSAPDSASSPRNS